MLFDELVLLFKETREWIGKRANTDTKEIKMIINKTIPQALYTMEKLLNMNTIHQIERREKKQLFYQVFFEIMYKVSHFPRAGLPQNFLYSFPPSLYSSRNLVSLSVF